MAGPPPSLNPPPIEPYLSIKVTSDTFFIFVLIVVLIMYYLLLLLLLIYHVIEIMFNY